MAWTKWSYMDHWVTETPQGPQPPSFNRAYMDRYVKQLSALGFTGFDTFFFYLPLCAGMSTSGLIHHATPGGGAPRSPAVSSTNTVASLP